MRVKKYAHDEQHIWFGHIQLTGPEAERMIAELVKQVAQLNTENEMLKGGITHSMKVADNSAEKASMFNGIMRDCALDLARAGNYAHKEKNEVILAVVARLLAFGDEPKKPRDMDDIPF